jgi:hypothetical protein
MKKLMLLAAAPLMLAACLTHARESVEVPTFTSPCTIGATCPNGSDLDPAHDHTDEWQNLTCQDACRLLLQDKVVGFGEITSCEPMRLDEGFWKVTCDYTYDPDEGNGNEAM